MSEKAHLLKGDTLFISDVHLGGFSAEKNQEIEGRLIALLQLALEKELRVYVLGDLFDYWMEYRGQWPAYGERVLKVFEDLNTRQPGLFVTGNHDNWTGQRLKRAGFDLEHEYRIVDFNGTEVMLLHGDGLKDPAFRFPRPRFHRMLRNAYFLRIFQTLFPPKAGIELMRQFSHTSKLRETNEAITKQTRHLDGRALAILGSGHVEVLICGHHHRSVFKKINDGLYINLGNFCFDSSMAVYTSRGFQLVRWHAVSQQFHIINSQ